MVKPDVGSAPGREYEYEIDERKSEELLEYWRDEGWEPEYREGQKFLAKTIERPAKVPPGYHKVLQVKGQFQARTLNRILTYISRHPGGRQIRIQEWVLKERIARRRVRSLKTVWRLLNWLETQGFIERTKEKAVRRIKRATRLRTEVLNLEIDVYLIGIYKKDPANSQSKDTKISIRQRWNFEVGELPPSKTWDEWAWIFNELKGDFNLESAEVKRHIGDRTGVPTRIADQAELEGIMSYDVEGLPGLKAFLINIRTRAGLGTEPGVEPDTTQQTILTQFREFR